MRNVMSEETLVKIGLDLQKYIELQLDHILPNTREALVKSVIEIIKNNVQITETEDPHLINQTIAEALAQDTTFGYQEEDDDVFAGVL